jgi:peroxiredoxin
MTIQVGDSIPSLTIKTPSADGPKDIALDDVFKDKKVVMFAVPGAFTPGCSNTHMPGFIVHADNIKAKGVDTIACLAVNDAFVMGAWAKSQNADELLMLADGNCELTEALGLILDGSGAGLGNRSKRYAMIVEDGVVTSLNIDEKGIEKSTAETILQQL